jgi:serine/threonine protein kinase
LDRADLDDKEVMLLEREIYLHSEVDHPHIIKLWDTIANEKSIFLVMELAENSNLFSYQNKKKAIP